MTKSVVVVAGTGNKNFPTVNIVTSTQAGADNATSISPGTSEHKKVQAASSVVKGLKTLCVPNYSSGAIATAVQFHHYNYLKTGDFVSDNPKGTISFWTYMTEGSFPLPKLFGVGIGNNEVLDCDGGWNTEVDVYLTINTNDPRVDIFTEDGTTATLLQGVWTHIFFAWDVGKPAGEKIGYLWFQGADAGAIVNDHGGDSATVPYTGNHLAIAKADGSDPNGYADFMFWIGQTIDPSVHIAKFRNPGTGKAVDPAVAIAAFGTPDVLWSGDHTGFIVNQGTTAASTLLATSFTGFGLASPGAIVFAADPVRTMPAGTVVASVIRTEDAHNVSSDFESIVSVTGQLQQLHGDYSATEVVISFVPHLDDATTSPRD